MCVCAHIGQKQGKKSSCRIIKTVYIALHSESLTSKLKAFCCVRYFFPVIPLFLSDLISYSKSKHAFLIIIQHGKKNVLCDASSGAYLIKIYMQFT